MLSVSKTHRSLVKDGQPFFYLADTCWSAFTNIEDHEWEYYLDLRKEQGFNTLQINILPQWDASQTWLEHDPFEQNENGQWNYFHIRDDYFEHARAMAKTAKDKGFELALVVLWCNYVPDTWASAFYSKGIMPFEALDGYLNKVNETFTDLDPLYVISGDTDFNTERAASYYIYASDFLKKAAPQCLQTTHIKGRYTELPADLEKNLDLLFYQSGHNRQDLTMPWKLALEMQEKYPGKPLINSEPCYEDMGFSRQMYGRWTQREIRKAAWESILAGASAGITYGASGIYSWHQTSSWFDAARGEGFAKPQAWQDAVKFPGAWDYGWIKWWMETYQIESFTCAQTLLHHEKKEIRVGLADNGWIAIYSPANTPFVLNGDYTQWSATAFDLEKGHIGFPRLVPAGEDTMVDLMRFQADALILLKPADK